MIVRHLMSVLQSRALEYPVVTLTGPRQSGKTTLCRTAFPEKPYRNLERPDIRNFAQLDPAGFLAQFPKGAVLDEGLAGVGVGRVAEGHGARAIHGESTCAAADDTGLGDVTRAAEGQVVRAVGDAAGESQQTRI